MSSGEIVSIPNRTVYPDYNGSTIRGLIEEFYARVGVEQGKLDTAITELKEVVGTFNPIVTPIDISAPTIDGPSFPETPVWPTINLDDSWPDGIGAEPVLMPFGNMEFEYVTPTLPDEIDGNFSWNITDYTSTMWAALFAKVHGDIQNGGTGLTQSVHDAIVAREQEARRINQDRDYSQGMDAVGSTGFNLPSGHIAAFQAEFLREKLLRDQDALNNITIKDFDLATENTRFAVTTGKELEQMLRATWEIVQKLGLEASRATYDYILMVYEANIKRYLAIWEGVKLDLEALKIKIDAIVSYNDGKIKIYLGKAEVYKTEIEAITSKNDGLIKSRIGEIEAHKTKIQAIEVQYNALVSEATLEIEAVKLEVLQAVENSKIDLEAYIAESSLAEKVAESIMIVGGQSVASTLGAINTSLSNSFSSSAANSESWGHTESLSEGHSFEEE